LSFIFVPRLVREQDAASEGSIAETQTATLIIKMSNQELDQKIRNSYIELVDLCVSEELRSELRAFFQNLSSYEGHAGFYTTLKFVMSHLDDNGIHFIMGLDWKASLADLRWRINSCLKDHHNVEVSLPTEDKYSPDTAISNESIFEDFNSPLNSVGLQLGFIDTQSDEYVIIIHRCEDRAKVSVAVNGIGYPNFDRNQPVL